MNTQIANRERFFPRLNFSGSYPSSSTSTTVQQVEDDGGMVDVEGKVKTRLLSMWNNVKYGISTSSETQPLLTPYMF